MKILLEKFRALRAQDIGNKKIALIILVCLIIVYIDFATLVKSQRNAVKVISIKTAGLKGDIAKLTRDLDNLKNRQKEIGEKARLRFKKIIFENELPALLEKIYLMANKNNAKIIKILPAKGPGSNSISLAMDLSCGYHNLARFINALENAEEFMAVEEIKIRPNAGDYFQQDVNLALRVYVKK